MSRIPDEPTAPWTTLSSERPVVTPWFAVRRDRVLTHSGQEISYTYVDRGGAVFIVPVTAQGAVLLLRQYRYPVHDWCWEVPAGAIEAGEDGAVAARRELQEEMGGICQSLRYVAAYYPSNGISNERSHVYLATGVERHESSPEHTELLHVVAVPQDDALRMARAGEITDGQSALALLLCEPYLRGNG
jgi:ADP-ribose pyrophosphatase